MVPERGYKANIVDRWQSVSLIIPTIQYMVFALIIIYAKYSILWFLSLRDSNTFNDTKNCYVNKKCK